MFLETPIHGGACSRRQHDMLRPEKDPSMSLAFWSSCIAACCITARAIDLALLFASSWGKDQDLIDGQSREAVGDSCNKTTGR